MIYAKATVSMFIVDFGDSDVSWRAMTSVIGAMVGLRFISPSGGFRCSDGLGYASSPPGRV
jgi:hypothetical protein